MTTDLLVETRVSSVARLKLNRPAKRNALSSALIRDLLAFFNNLENSEEFRAVVIEGVGATFCSGLDLNERRGENVASGGLFAQLLLAISESRVPVVAKLHGHVPAGGLALAAVCDIAVCDEAASFSIPEVRLGLVPGITTAVLNRKVPASHIPRYALTGDSFGAEAALGMGLVTSVCARDGLENCVIGIVRSLLMSSPSAVQQTKQRLTGLSRGPGWHSLLQEGVVVSDSGMNSADAVEGLAAHHARRDPQWAVRI